MTDRKKQYSGSISYEKLFSVMDDKGIKKTNLRNEYSISPTIIRRLNNDETVSIDTIMYLCEILSCQPGDIVEYIPAKK